MCNQRTVAPSETRGSSFVFRRVFCTCPFAYMRFHYTRRYEELAPLDPAPLPTVLISVRAYVSRRMTDFRRTYGAQFWNYRENK